MNYQRDQVAAIREKQNTRNDKEDSDSPHEKPFSAAVTDASLARSTITGAVLIKNSLIDLAIVFIILSYLLGSISVLEKVNDYNKGIHNFT